MSKILITGANGFIGSHTTLLMENLGHEVIPIDVGPRSPDLSLLGIRASSHIMNVTDSAAFRALCEKEKPTHIFHAAHPPRDETPTVLNYCYHAMTNILEAAKDLKIQRVVYSSSASIYGPLQKPDGSLVKEDDAVTIYPTYFTAPRRQSPNGWEIFTKKNTASISSPCATRRCTAQACIGAFRWNSRKVFSAKPAGPFSPGRWTI